MRADRRRCEAGFVVCFFLLRPCFCTSRLISQNPGTESWFAADAGSIAADAASVAEDAGVFFAAAAGVLFAAAAGVLFAEDAASTSADAGVLFAADAASI